MSGFPEVCKLFFKSHFLSFAIFENCVKDFSGLKNDTELKFSGNVPYDIYCDMTLSVFCLKK